MSALRTLILTSAGYHAMRGDESYQPSEPFTRFPNYGILCLLAPHADSGCVGNFPTRGPRLNGRWKKSVTPSRLGRKVSQRAANYRTKLGGVIWEFSFESN